MAHHAHQGSGARPRRRFVAAARRPGRREGKAVRRHGSARSAGAHPPRARPGHAADAHRDVAVRDLVAGNLGGDPDASGTRVVRAVFDDLSLEWTEQLDHSEIRGQGVIGFDASADRFFSSSLYSAGPGAEFLAGLLDDAEPRITFTSLPLSAEPAPGTAPVRSAALMLLDRDHFTWTPLDHG